MLLCLQSLHIWWSRNIKLNLNQHHPVKLPLDDHKTILGLSKRCHFFQQSCIFLFLRYFGFKWTRYHVHQIVNSLVSWCENLNVSWLEFSINHVIDDVNCRVTNNLNKIFIIWRLFFNVFIWKQLCIRQINFMNFIERFQYSRIWRFFFPLKEQLKHQCQRFFHVFHQVQTVNIAQAWIFCPLLWPIYSPMYEE